MSHTSPLVSVIVPLFNREAFLPQLFETMAKQRYTHFELILVDDGSTDNSEQWLAQHTLPGGQKVIYVKQENAGPYAARNHGVSLASGEFIAFQDSDDEWPDYHLSEFVEILQQHPDLDLVFGSIQRIQHDSREVVSASNYVQADGKPHPFLTLSTEQRGELFVVSDPALAKTAVTDGLPGSTQCTLFRRKVFDALQFDASFRSTYDRFFGTRVALAGFKIGYVNKTHQIYHIHDQHVSLVAGMTPEKLEKSAQAHIKGYLGLLKDFGHDKSLAKAAKYRLAKYYAYYLAPALQQQHKLKQARQAYTQALWLEKANLRYLKYTLVALCKQLVKD